MTRRWRNEGLDPGHRDASWDEAPTRETVGDGNQDSYRRRVYASAQERCANVMQRREASQKADPRVEEGERET